MSHTCARKAQNGSTEPLVAGLACVGSCLGIEGGNKKCGGTNAGGVVGTDVGWMSGGSVCWAERAIPLMSSIPIPMPRPTPMPIRARSDI